MTNTKEFRRFAETATPGSWWHEKPDRYDRGSGVIWTCGPYPKSVAHVLNSDECANRSGTTGVEFEATSDFIAAANPKAVLAILDELDALRADRTTRDREKFNEGIKAAADYLANARGGEDAVIRTIRALTTAESGGRGDRDD